MNRTMLFAPLTALLAAFFSCAPDRKPVHKHALVDIRPVIRALAERPLPATITECLARVSAYAAAETPAEALRAPSRDAACVRFSGSADNLTIGWYREGNGVEVLSLDLATTQERLYRSSTTFLRLRITLENDSLMNAEAWLSFNCPEDGEMYTFVAQRAEPLSYRLRVERGTDGTYQMSCTPRFLVRATAESYELSWEERAPLTLPVSPTFAHEIAFLARGMQRLLERHVSS